MYLLNKNALTSKKYQNVKTNYYCCRQRHGGLQVL